MTETLTVRYRSKKRDCTFLSSIVCPKKHRRSLLRSWDLLVYVAFVWTAAEKRELILWHVGGKNHVDQVVDPSIHETVPQLAARTIDRRNIETTTIDLFGMPV